MSPPPAAPSSQAGFTLIEVMISLALFALIAVAGVALVDSVLRIQAHTAGRLERLGDVQRAMFVIANDLAQVTAGRVVGDGGGVAFVRVGASAGAGRAGSQPIAYRLAGSTLTRTVGKAGVQRLLGDVAAVRWRYYRAGAGWADHWPPSPPRADEWPDAVAVDILLRPLPDRPGGTLRRIVALPTQP